MQLNTITHQTFALAGIAQSAALVDQLATTGTCDHNALTASIGSILKIDSPSVLDVFGGIHGLKLGMENLSMQMNGYKIVSHQQARYAASLVFIENQLSKRKDMQKTIQEGIVKAQHQAEQFGLLHDNVFAGLAELYHSTLSTLQPRVMVNGDPAYIERSDITNKIRATLLAGIRSAFLWRQCGGTRWKFLFYRKKIQQELKKQLQCL
jgi:high frequency lysogenization protein